MKDEIECLICDTAVLWRRLFNSQSKSIGISNIERRIIISVDRNPGATQIDIAHLLDIEPQNLIRPLDKLVAAKLIEKRASTKDRRVNCLYTTTQCQFILKKIHQMADTVRPIALKSLSAEDIKQLRENIKKIKTNLELQLSPNPQD